MATGVGAALINLALELGVTARSIALVALLVTCLLSIATGFVLAKYIAINNSLSKPPIFADWRKNAKITLVMSKGCLPLKTL